MAELNQLFRNLGIHEKAAIADNSFAKELSETEFRIFEPISDLGYFSWEVVDTATGYKDINTLKSSNEITQYINEDGKPDNLKSVSSIPLPHRFKRIEPLEHENKYPYGQIDIGCLYVAVKHRMVDLNKIHFAFGGSTLEMLANKDASSPYIATRIPGTDCILVVKRKVYTQDLSDHGFQFERLVTGKTVPDAGTAEFIEHMHLMKVGDYNVLFRAETDAIQHGSPVEIKASNPRYWGTKVMFQMISSGSTKLCHGEKFRGAVNRITMKSLSTVAREALACSSISQLQKNIVDGMDAIDSQLKHDELKKINFSPVGSLQLTPTSERVSALLPPAEVVKSVLG